MRNLMFAVCAAALLAASKGEPAVRPQAKAPAVDPAFVPVSPILAAEAGLAGGSDVTGKVTYKGDKVRRRKVKMGADPYCEAAHSESVYDQGANIGEDGGVQWAFVWVKNAPAVEAPKDAVPLTQTGCMYEPHVFGIVAGQPIKIVNSDETNHNIHAWPKTNPDFNFSQPKKGMEAEKTFATPEMEVKIKCDVHPWMIAYCHVLTHNYFAVSSESGEFKISGLPAGKYTVSVWHEGLTGAKDVEIEVDGTAAKDGVNFELNAKKE